MGVFGPRTVPPLVAPFLSRRHTLPPEQPFADLALAFAGCLSPFHDVSSVPVVAQEFPFGIDFFDLGMKAFPIRSS